MSNDFYGESTPIIFINGLGCAGSFDYVEATLRNWLPKAVLEMSVNAVRGGKYSGEIFCINLIFQNISFWRKIT